MTLEFLNPCMAPSPDRKTKSCRGLLRQLLRSTCVRCKMQSTTLSQWTAGMHLHFRHALFEMEAAVYREVTGKTVGRNHVETWSATTHRLCLLRASYSILGDRHHASTFWRKLFQPDHRFHCIAAVLQSGNDDRVKWNQLVFRPNASSVDSLHKGLLHSLRDVDVSPQTTGEHFKMEIVRSLCHRCVALREPLILTLLVEHTSEPIEALVHYILNAFESAYSVRCSLLDALKLLSQEEKRLVKFCLLYSKKMRQFGVRYARDELKCAAVNSGHNEDRWLVFCNYCMELLTYTNIGKRPPSFGPYLHSEMLQMRCFKCDSAELVAIPCGNPARGISLEMGHPDRHPVGFCRGRRKCTNVSGYPSRECSQCCSSRRQLEPDESFLHGGTCLDSDKGFEECCAACQHCWRKDPGLAERLRARPVQRTADPDPKPACSVAGSEASRKMFRSACMRAALDKKRKLLIK